MAEGGSQEGEIRQGATGGQSHDETKERTEEGKRRKERRKKRWMARIKEQGKEKEKKKGRWMGAGAQQGSRGIRTGQGDSPTKQASRGDLAPPQKKQKKMR